MTDWDWDSILRWVERGSAVLGPLFGILIGSHLATRQSREQRRHDWVKRQIEEFYSPILGLLERALALSGLRTEIGTAADEAWRLQVEQGEITDAFRPHYCVQQRTAPGRDSPALRRNADDF